MTDRQPQDAGQAPVPGAAPAPVPAADPTPRQEAAVPPASQQQEQSGRAAALEAELAKIRADALAGAKVVLRVLEPHVQFTFGGVTVTSDPTPVPAHAVGPLMTAAAEAGVKLAEEA